MVYGNSKCGLDLRDILIKMNNPQYNRKAGRTYSGFKLGINMIYNRMGDLTPHFLRIYLEHYKNNINSLKLPDDVKTRLQNLIKGEYRKKLHQYNKKMKMGDTYIAGVDVANGEDSEVVILGVKEGGVIRYKGGDENK